MKVKKVKKTCQFYNSIINKRIREYLDNTENNISAKEFAKLIDVSYETVRQWRNGYSRPDVDKIDKLTKIMNCSVEYLLRENGCKNIKNTSANKDFNLSEDAIESLRAMKNKDFYSGLGFEIHHSELDIIPTNIISYFICQPNFWNLLQKQMISCIRYYNESEYANNINKLTNNIINNPFYFSNIIINNEFDTLFRNYVIDYLKRKNPNINLDIN